MKRPRTVRAAHGLLDRMEVRPRKDGLVTYRYRPVGGKPINLARTASRRSRRFSTCWAPVTTCTWTLELGRARLAFADHIGAVRTWLAPY
jgi:hypothetical protein